MQPSRRSLRRSILSFPLGAPLFVSMTAIACGDGVGRPIVAGGAAGAPIATDGSTGDVPPGPYCAAVAEVSAEVAATELAFLDAINGLRQGAGNGCGGVSFGGLLPLVLSPALRCSARLHAADMNAHMYFSQTDLAGTEPPARMQAAGFPASAAFEDIASGELAGPLGFPPTIQGGESPGCALGDGMLTYAGVGRSGNLWAVDVARP